MKKIFFFENLDRINFYFCLLLIPFYKKIYFRQATFAKNNSFFKRNLNNIFIQKGLLNLDGSLANKAYILKKFLIKKYINNDFKTEFFDKFSELNKIQDKQKTIYSLEMQIYASNILAVDGTSYICIKKFFPNNSVYYFPSMKKTILTMSQIQNKKLTIVSALVLIRDASLILNYLFTIVYNKIKNIFKSSNIILNKSSSIHKENNNNSNVKKINSCGVGYFPHMGLKYGTFFNKNFFYSDSINSPLYKKNIDTISFEKHLELTTRYLKFFKLEASQTCDISKIPSLKEIFTYIVFFFKNKKFINKRKLINFIIFFEMYLSINRFNKFFKDKKYKVLIFYNDDELPPTILLSASINQIKTISFQDRLLAYFYHHRVFFDLYLVAGKEFKKILKNQFMIKKHEVLGLIRPDLITQQKHLSFPEELEKRKINGGIITCLLLGHRTDWNVNLFGEDGTSHKSILNFCKDIKRLSKIFKDKHFVIKFKHVDLRKDAPSLLVSVNEIISGSDNIVLIEPGISYNVQKTVTSDKITSVKLIENSDLIIGKYSTIMDEALVAGKNILIHDAENFVSSFGFYRKNKFLISSNFEELQFKVKNILEGNNEFSKYYMKKKKDYIKNYLTDEGITGNPKKMVKIIEKYIQDLP